VRRKIEALIFALEGSPSEDAVHDLILESM